MRSTATPTDQNDMKKKMNATALATQPIWFHISMRFRSTHSLHPPG